MATSRKLKDDFLTCHICMEVYQKPCTLHCEHTYCQGCLTKYIKTQSDAIKAKYIPCPSCRHHIPVPHPDRPVGEWAGQFRPGLVIQGLMDSFSQGSSDVNNCTVCNEGGETTPATHWCSECESSLCGGCLKFHRRMPSIRHHNVVDLSGETPRVQWKKQFVCKDHDEKKKLFCIDCRKTLCTICCSVDHRACKNVVTIQAMLPEVKQELSGRQKRIEDDIDRTSKQIYEHKKIVDDVIAKSRLVKREIKQSFNDIYKLLQQKEQQLIDKVGDITNTQTGELRSKVKAEEITKQMYQQQFQFIQTALTFEDEAQLYEMYLSSESGTVADNTWTDRGDRPDVIDISFTHNIEKLREDIDMMDVRTVWQPFRGTVCDDVIDLTATPVLHEVVEMKMKDDENNPALRDLVVVNVNDIKTIVVTDFNNNSIKSVYVNNGRTCNSQLKLNNMPWSLTLLNENNVVVTVPSVKKILTVSVNPDLVLLFTITTNKDYHGLAVLDQSTLVAGSDSPPSVDVLDMTGNVLRSFTTLTSIQKTFMSPYFLHVTNQGNILVSDWGLKSVICLTPTGEVVFHYTPTGDRALRSPYGITSTTRGDILVADISIHKVVHITESGQYVQDILTSQNGLKYPIGLCVDGYKLYVATEYSGVHVFKSSPNAIYISFCDMSTIIPSTYMTIFH